MSSVTTTKFDIEKLSISQRIIFVPNFRLRNSCMNSAPLAELFFLERQNGQQAERGCSFSSFY